MAAIQRIVNLYESLVLHLGAIIADSLIFPKKMRVYTDKGHKMAKELKDNLTDASLVALLFLQLDVLSLTSVQSLFYQHSAQSIIGIIFKMYMVILFDYLLDIFEN